MLFHVVVDIDVDVDVDADADADVDTDFDFVVDVLCACGDRMLLSGVGACGRYLRSCQNSTNLTPDGLNIKCTNLEELEAEEVQAEALTPAD